MKKGQKGSTGRAIGKVLRLMVITLLVQAGINYDPFQPGFQHVIIEPCFPRRLEWAEGRYQSRAGLIVSRWERQEGQIVLTVEIPTNATATLRLGGAEHEVGAGKHTFRLPDR